MPNTEVKLTNADDTRRVIAKTRLLRRLLRAIALSFGLKYAKSRHI